MSGSQFLHERNPNMHSAQEVETVVGYLRNGGESIPNNPADKISAYLGFLANREYVNDGILTGDQASIDRQIEAHVIGAEDVPEGYFELQRRIAREQGHGDVQITSEMRRLMTEAVQADQRAGLGKWVEYLGGDDGGYPDWFKHYTWTSVTKLGTYDKDKSEFQKRSRGTTAPYPELNREALAYVYDNLNTHRVQGASLEDLDAEAPELQKLLKSANFGKLYAHAIKETAPTDPELLTDTTGSWTMFHQTDDPRTARRLSESLRGHGTGWCTAGESTAAIQLRGGDFYVYYTRDDKGNDTVPRVAIRMEDGRVAEVRGIQPDQNLEGVMTDLTMTKIQELPGGAEYHQKADDMKRLTEIERKLAANPTAPLSKAEVKFLYEVGHSIQGFGYARDPRINELKAQRGERDHPELKILAVESLRENFEAAYSGYASVVEELNALRTPAEQLPVLGREQVADMFEVRLEHWRQQGILDYVAERIITHGELYTPVARANVLASVAELKVLANNFAKSQGFDEAYIYHELYDAYTTEKEIAQLSGYQKGGEIVQFSLIPDKFSEELGFRSMANQRLTLELLRTQQPELNIHVPNLLDSQSFWRTLRAQGDRLKGGDVWGRTGIRHLDLKPKQVGWWLGVPLSDVGGDGGPFLRGSGAENGDGARLAVG